MEKQPFAGGCRRSREDFRYPQKGLFALAFWPQEFAITAAYQSEAALYKADGATAQIMGFPRAYRDSFPAKKAFGDLAIGFALAAAVEGPQGQGEPLAPLRRQLWQRRTWRTAAQRAPKRLSGLRSEFKRRI